MINKITSILKNFTLSRALLSYIETGYLYEIGWINSYNQKLPIAKDGSPLPWVTYSFIEFIRNKITNLEIFEYGSGNSSFFYTRYCKHLTSVEHEKEWYDKLLSTIPKNMTLIFAELSDGEKYATSSVDTGKKYQMVIVDGRQRVNCIMKSINALTEDGVIILDDSERKEYIVGINFLKKNGFKAIDFWGISPGLFYNKSTSIYYRTNNCIGI